MKNLITALLLLGFTMVSLESFSQELQDSTNIKKKDYAQQYDYENYLYPFAPEKKNNWALGISGGYHSLIADIRSRGGFVAGLNIQKALGHLIALRLSGSYAASKGLDWRPSENNGTTFYKNYESKIATVALSAVVSLNNINFHKRQPDVIFNLIGGIGLALFQANHDLEDANGNAYNYAGINQATDFGARSGVISQLDALLDGDFESSIVNSNLDPTLGDWQMAAYVNVGAGITYRISRRVDLAFEYLVGWYASDWMDGDENRRDGNPSKSTDLSQNLTVGFNFKLGKGEESLWWSNPLFTPYNDIAELKKKVLRKISSLMQMMMVLRISSMKRKTLLRIHRLPPKELHWILTRMDSRTDWMPNLSRLKVRKWMSQAQHSMAIVTVCRIFTIRNWIHQMVRWLMPKDSRSRKVDPADWV